jgi:hypothetical protein
MMPNVVPTAWRLLSLARRGLGLALVVAATAGPALADPSCDPPHTPEIDAGSLATVVTPLTGGVLMLTDRLRK